MRTKAKFFLTRKLPGGEVKITWSDKTDDSSAWDPLDFWIVPEGEAEEAIGKISKGFEI